MFDFKGLGIFLLLVIAIIVHTLYHDLQLVWELSGRTYGCLHGCHMRYPDEYLDRWRGTFCWSRTLPRWVTLTGGNTAICCLARNQSLCTGLPLQKSMFQSMSALKTCWSKMVKTGQDHFVSLGVCFSTQIWNTVVCGECFYFRCSWVRCSFTDWGGQHMRAPFTGAAALLVLTAENGIVLVWWGISRKVTALFLLLPIT